MHETKFRCNFYITTNIIMLSCDYNNLKKTSLKFIYILNTDNFIILLNNYNLNFIINTLFIFIYDNYADIFIILLIFYFKYLYKSAKFINSINNLNKDKCTKGLRRVSRSLRPTLRGIASYRR